MEPVSSSPPSATQGRRSKRRVLLRRIGLGLLGLVLSLLALLGYVGLRVRSTLLRTVPAPESATGLRAVGEVRTSRTVVVTAHPEATRIGREVLAAGGSAIDAAVAVQAALTLVEPQSSGLGGGAFLLYYDAGRGVLKAYDGRETAPRAATPSLFLDDKGKPQLFPLALVGGRSVGVPGVVRLLAFAHARHGRLSWSQLFSGAAALAEQGFTVTPRLHALIKSDPILPAMPETRRYFFEDDGSARSVGSLLRNPELAETLRLIAHDGPDAFYGGAIARDIVLAVQSARRPSLSRLFFNLVSRELGAATMGSAAIAAGGGLDSSDLAAYSVREREPLCVPYRRYRVCGFPPPSSGGVTLLQSLRMLERFDLAQLGPSSAEALHLLTEAERLAYADREQWIGDPEFANVPTSGLLDTEYLKQRGALIRTDRSLGVAAAGAPPGAQAGAVPSTSHDVPSTSHFVIVDAQGNIACATSSIEFGFGSHVMVRGFLLNNQLTDFSFVPMRAGQPVINAVAAGKRPRSAMAPTLVFDAATGRPLLALGSPGGARIIGYVLRALTGVLDFKLSAQQAVALPHVLSTNGQTEIEDVGWPSRAARDELVSALKARRHDVSIGQQNSGLHAVMFTDTGLSAGIDPRREGAAAGE